MEAFLKKHYKVTSLVLIVLSILCFHYLQNNILSDVGNFIADYVTAFGNIDIHLPMGIVFNFPIDFTQ